MSDLILVEHNSRATLVEDPSNLTTPFFAFLTAQAIKIGFYHFRPLEGIDVEGLKAAMIFHKICRRAKILVPEVFTLGQLNRSANEETVIHNYLLRSDMRAKDVQAGGFSKEGLPSAGLKEVSGHLPDYYTQIICDAIHRLGITMSTNTYDLNSGRGYIVPPSAYMVRGFLDYRAEFIVPEVGLLDLMDVNPVRCGLEEIIETNTQHAQTFCGLFTGLTGYSAV